MKAICMATKTQDRRDEIRESGMGVKTRSKSCKWLINFKIYIYICINKHFNKYIFKNQCSDISLCYRILL